MPALSTYDYAVVRVVPHVDRGEFVNAGVIVSCTATRFLAARIELDEARLLALAPDLDLTCRVQRGTGDRGSADHGLGTG